MPKFVLFLIKYNKKNINIIQKENPAKSLQRGNIIINWQKKKSNLPVSPQTPSKYGKKNCFPRTSNNKNNKKEPPNQTTNDKIKRLIALEIFRTLPEK